MKRLYSTSGFTVAEIVVVLAVVGLLSAVVVGGVSGSREKARDERRMSDLQQIQVALRLYAEENGEYPCQSEAECSSPTQTEDANGLIGVGNYIDTLLEPYMSSIPSDPQQSNSDYYYAYEGRAGCNSASNDQKVIFVKTLETEQHRNWDTLCTCESSCGIFGGRPTDGHIIILE